MSQRLNNKKFFCVFNGAVTDDYLLANLKSFGMQLVEISDEADFIICEIGSLAWDDLPEESMDRPVVVGWLTGNTDFQLEKVLALGLDCILVREMTLLEQKLALSMGLQNCELNMRLRDRLSKVTEQLRSAAIIERAKLILSNSKECSELDAYKFLREQAMRKRISVLELANSVVDAHDIFS